MKTKGNKSFQRNTGERLKIYIAKQKRRAALNAATRLARRQALRKATGVTHAK